MGGFACASGDRPTSEEMLSQAKPSLSQQGAGEAQGRSSRCWYLPGKVSPAPTAKPWGTSIIVSKPSTASLLQCRFQSQLKVGGQEGPGDKGQSESRRSCFHCFSMNSQPLILFSGKLLSLQCNFHLWDQT